MKIQVKGRNVAVTDALQDYAHEKLGKVQRLLRERRIDEVSRLELELMVEKNPAIPNNNVAEATIFTGGPVIRAREASDDMYAAIDLVTDKLQRRVKKYHDKRHHKTHHKYATEKAGLVVAVEEAAAAAAAGEVSPAEVAEVAAVAAAATNGHATAATAAPTETIAAVAEDDHGSVVKVKRFAMKPMSVEEATLQLELVGHDFFVFRNADTDDTNVVYRRRDNHYGLIMPEPA
jgi:putative sigma-54 modulation protein